MLKMKRITITLIAFLLLSLGLCACTANKIPDFSKATRIEIRCFSNTDQTYTDHTISDADIVRNICDTLEGLELKKIKLTEPLHQSYTMTFYYPNGGRIGSVTLVSGHNVIDCGDMYKIKNEININEYISELISKIP